MTRRTKVFLYGLAAFALLSLLIVTTAYMQGADPFHPRSRHIWALSLIAAAYAGFRGAIIVDRMMKWSSGGPDERPKLPGFGMLGGKTHAIDKRMAARKARVEAARNKQETQDTDPE